jgi:hypothetical protein
MLGSDRMSDLLMNWEPKAVTSSEFKYTNDIPTEIADSSYGGWSARSGSSASQSSNAESKIDLPPSQGGHRNKNVKSSERSGSDRPGMSSSKIHTEKTKPFVMRMPQGDPEVYSRQSTPSPKPRRVVSSSSDSYVFMDTPVASSDILGKRGKTDTKSSMSDESPIPCFESREQELARKQGVSVPGGLPQSDTKWDVESRSWRAPSKKSFGYDHSKSQYECGGWGDGPADVKSLGDGWEKASGGAKSTLPPHLWNEYSHSSSKQRQLENKISALEDRLDGQQKSLQGLLGSHKEPSGLSNKDFVDLLQTAKSLMTRESAPQADTTIREAIHRVEVELAKLTVRDSAPSFASNSDGELALREVKRLEGILHSAVDTIGRQASLLNTLQQQQLSHAATCQQNATSCEQRIIDCESQMERYPGDWDIAEFKERINTSVDFDEKLLQKLDVVNERLSSLEEHSVSKTGYYNSWSEWVVYKCCKCRSTDHWPGECVIADKKMDILFSWEACSSCEHCGEKGNITHACSEGMHDASPYCFCGREHDTRKWCRECKPQPAQDPNSTPEAEHKTHYTCAFGQSHNKYASCGTCDEPGDLWSCDNDGTCRAYCESCFTGRPAGLCPMAVTYMCWTCAGEHHSSACPEYGVPESEKPHSSKECWLCAGEHPYDEVCPADEESKSNNDSVCDNDPCELPKKTESDKASICDDGQTEYHNEAAAGEDHGASIEQDDQSADCTKCGWTSHTSSDCPNFGLYCNQCKESGHVCPEFPQYDPCNACGSEHHVEYECTKNFSASLKPTNISSIKLPPPGVDLNEAWARADAALNGGWGLRLHNRCFICHGLNQSTCRGPDRQLYCKPCYDRGYGRTENAALDFACQHCHQYHYPDLSCTRALEASW